VVYRAVQPRSLESLSELSIYLIGYLWTQSDPCSERSLPALSADPDELAGLFVDQMIHGDASTEVERLVFDEISRVPPAIKSAILFDQSVRDYRDVLEHVDVPTLVCVGEDDTLVDPAGVEYVAERTPDATVERFARSSHCPFLEEPERFNQALSSFVADC